MLINDKKSDVIVVTIGLLMCAGIFFWIAKPETPSELQSVLATTSQVCTSINDLPDHNCTPGAINPDITQANISQTICKKGWSTSSIRPSVVYTNKLKAQQMVDYNLTGTLKDYEEDHLISLELGGAPKDPRNLWPENYTSQPYNAHTKDKIENILHSLICSGQISLQEAQKDISTDWIFAYQKYVLHGILPSVSAQSGPLSSGALDSASSSPYLGSYPSTSLDVDDSD